MRLKIALLYFKIQLREAIQLHYFFIGKSSITDRAYIIAIIGKDKINIF